MYRERFSKAVADLLAADEWLLAETEYRPAENLVWEARFGLTNGRMGNRGTHEEGDVRHTLPANYIHGVFDRSEAFMRELCNTPDWTKLKLYYSCQPIGVESGKALDYIRVLDMRHGILAKHYICEREDGRRTQVEVLKFLSRANPRRAFLRMYVTPLNYEGLFEFENIIDASVTNFMDFPRFRVKHLHTRSIHSLQGMGCYVESETRDFGLAVGTGTVLRMHTQNRQNALKSRVFRPYGEIACEFADARLEQGETLCIDKYCAIATERDCVGVEAQVKRELEAALVRGFEQELAQHTDCLAAMWDAADMCIEGDDELTHALRFNIFHMMNTPDPMDNRVNIGAKLMHGEEYGGHAFWDTELFVLPFFNYVFPHIAKNLVEYRYHLLDKALENAKGEGYRGAKYPWESADTGEEECPAWTIEYDGSCYRCYVADYEHHVTADIAYGIQNYVNITQDSSFMENKGAEILLQTARFWVSRMHWKTEKQRYEIRQVTGPDEWHEPVDNNAYTNHLARWNILTALSLLRTYQDSKPYLAQRLMEKLEIHEQELKDWEHRAEKLFLQAESGLIEQFDGYFSIPDTVVTQWDDKGMPLMPESCKGKKNMQRCILKQADVVMLMFLFPHAYDLQTQRINFDYYEPRTLHRSSLSPSIHCMMGLRVGDSKRAYDYLRRSAFVDLQNNQGNTREGIHAASAGGTWQCIALGYCGMHIDVDGILAFRPQLPANWSRITFSLVREGQLHRVELSKEGLRLVSSCSAIVYRVDGRECLSEVADEG